jgi:hypothetical protein
MPSSFEQQHDAFLLPNRMRELDETLIQYLLRLDEQAACEHVEEDQRGIIKSLRNDIRLLDSILQRMKRRLEGDSLQSALEAACKICRSTEGGFIDFFHPDTIENSDLLSYSQSLVNLDLARDVLNPEDRAEREKIESWYIDNQKHAFNRAEILTLDLHKSLKGVITQLPKELRVFFDLAIIFHDLKPSGSRKHNSTRSTIRRNYTYFDEVAKPRLSKQLKACRQFNPDFQRATKSRLNRFEYENFEASMKKLRDFAESTLKRQARPRALSEEPCPAVESPNSHAKSISPKILGSSEDLAANSTCLAYNTNQLIVFGIPFVYPR